MLMVNLNQGLIVDIFLSFQLFIAANQPGPETAELIPREQAGEFRLLSGTEPVCVQPIPPHGVLPATAGSPRESAPQHDE